MKPTCLKNLKIRNKDIVKCHDPVRNSSDREDTNKVMHPNQCRAQCHPGLRSRDSVQMLTSPTTKYTMSNEGTKNKVV